MNKVILVGNITRDAETVFTPNGTAICRIGVATNRSYKDKNTDQWKDIPEFTNVTLFGKAAEIVGQQCQKGDKILIEGRLETRKWIDKQQNTRYSTGVSAENFILFTPKKKDEQETIEEPPVPDEPEEEINDNQPDGSEDVNPDDLPI